MMPAMMDGLVSGKVKAFWVFGENLANTEPDIHHVEHCLESAEFMMCNDIFPPRPPALPTLSSRPRPGAKTTAPLPTASAG
jgi:hypothetical protein